MYGKTIAIPELGIKSYFISDDLEIGCCDKAQYQGVRVDGKHYIVPFNELDKFPVKHGMLIPSVAYELFKVAGSEGKIRDITEPSVLEKIALAIESEQFDGEATPRTQSTH
jgi:hypothetical protein